MDDRLAARLDAQRQRPTPPASAPSSPSTNGSRPSARWQRWMRWAHVYVSMVAFVIIGFFGATGLLLNHPSWLGGEDLVTTIEEGTLPDSVRTDEGVEFLAVSEYLRSEHGVVGEVTNFDQIGNEGSINYTGPAYGASARFDVVTLDYSVRITEENLVNAMRDLHTGSDTNTAWNLAIDVSAVLLLVVSVTGLGIQLLMRKRRASALGWLAVGTVVTTALVWLTLA
ncbi:MAG: PepSY-associated TM helix domain-containing protein [Actinomycetota bacterium]